MKIDFKGRSPRRMLAVFLLILAAIIIAGSGLAYYAFSAFSGNGTPSPSELYMSVISKPPFLKDALGGSYASNWETYTQGKASCTLRDGALHTSMEAENALDNHIDYLVVCSLHNAMFNNFALRVQMTVLQGNQTLAGVFFRSDAKMTHMYRFYLDFYGNYNFVTEENAEPAGTNLSVFMPGIIKNRSHVLMIIAQDTSIYLYIDGNYVNTISDTSYMSGGIGFFTTRNNLVTTDVAFSDVEVWKL